MTINCTDHLVKIKEISEAIKTLERHKKIKKYGKTYALNQDCFWETSVIEKEDDIENRRANMWGVDVY